MNFTGASYNAVWDKSESALHFYAGAEATFGNTSTSPDFRIWRDTSHIKLQAAAGTEHIQIEGGTTSGQNVEIYTNNTITGKFGYQSGGDGNYVRLYHDGTERLLTNSTGVKITGELEVTDDITAFSSSDKTLKDNITPIPNALDKVISISGNTFNWNEKSGKEGQGDTGVIAQEGEKLDLPGVTTTRDDGTKAVRYEKLVPLLIEAIKELKNEVDELKRGK